jgi:hypothetical protein
MINGARTCRQHVVALWQGHLGSSHISTEWPVSQSSLKTGTRRSTNAGQNIGCISGMERLRRAAQGTGDV